MAKSCHRTESELESLPLEDFLLLLKRNEHAYAFVYKAGKCSLVVISWSTLQLVRFLVLHLCLQKASALPVQSTLCHFEPVRQDADQHHKLLIIMQRRLPGLSAPGLVSRWYQNFRCILLILQPSSTPRPHS